MPLKIHGKPNLWNVLKPFYTGDLIGRKGGLEY